MNAPHLRTAAHPGPGSRRGGRNLPRRTGGRLLRQAVASVALPIIPWTIRRDSCIESAVGATRPNQKSSVRLRVIAYLLALLSSRRLWPAPMTAPLAAFPPMAPIAAPFAAPLALGWVVSLGGGCVFGGGCVAAGGVCAGGVCAGIWGIIAVITESAITIAEYLIWPLLGRPPVSRCCNICRTSARREHYLISFSVHYDSPPLV